MDKIDSDLVNLHDTQADQPDVTSVHLRTTQEDTRMLKPEIVDRIRELSGQGLGSKRIARQLGHSPSASPTRTRCAPSRRPSENAIAAEDDPNARNPACFNSRAETPSHGFGMTTPLSCS